MEGESKPGFNMCKVLRRKGALLPQSNRGQGNRWKVAMLLDGNPQENCGKYQIKGFLAVSLGKDNNDCKRLGDPELLGADSEFFRSAIYLFTRVMQTVLRVFIRIRLEDASKPAALHTLLS